MSQEINLVESNELLKLGAGGDVEGNKVYHTCIINSQNIYFS